MRSLNSSTASRASEAYDQAATQVAKRWQSGLDDPWGSRCDGHSNERTKQGRHPQAEHPPLQPRTHFTPLLFKSVGKVRLAQAVVKGAAGLKSHI